MGIVTRRDVLCLDAAASETGQLVHIASLVVQLTAAARATVGEVVATLPNAELHCTDHPNKIVIVLESAASRCVAQAADELQRIPGVLTVSIVAHLIEDAARLSETHEPTSIPAA